MDVYRQLKRMAKPLGLTVGDASADGAGIHRSLLAGLLSQIGIKDLAKDAKKKQGDYIGARQIRFTIFPGSALAKKQPNEIMTAELVETSRLFARMNAAIDLGLGGTAAPAISRKRSYGEPHWEKNQGSVVAYERVTLYGVPIVARRRVQYARVDPEQARELFIRHALVDGDWDLSRIDQRRLGVRPCQPRAAQAADRGRGAHPAARHPLRRRGGVRVLRPAHPRRRDTRSADSRSGGSRRWPRHRTGSP